MGYIKIRPMNKSDSYARTRWHVDLGYTVLADSLRFILFLLHDFTCDKADTMCYLFEFAYLG